MERVEFINLVAGHADVETTRAQAAIGATLTTLSERIPDEQAKDLAEQLPQEFGRNLTVADGFESFGYDEFVTRVAEREGDVTLDDRSVAARHAQAVVAVLLAAVKSEDSDDILSYLTRDYESLFDMVDPEEVWGPGWLERLGESG